MREINTASMFSSQTCCTPLWVPITENGSCNIREINTDSMLPFSVTAATHSIEGANHCENNGAATSLRNKH